MPFQGIGGNEQLFELAGSVTLLEALPMAVTLVEARTRRIAYRNAESRRIAARCGLPYDGTDTAGQMGFLWPDGTPLRPDEIPGVAALERGERSERTVILMPCLDGSKIVIAMESGPLALADGTIVGAMLTFRELTDKGETARWLSKIQHRLDATDRQRRFLTLLSEAIRDLDDPLEIVDFATRIVGVHLNVNRCAYGTLDVDRDALRVFRGYVADVESDAGSYRLSQFGEGVFARQRSGQTVVIEDASIDPLTRGDYASTYLPLRLRALVSVPLVKANRLIAFFAVNHSEPRAWTADEVRLVEEVAERIWSTIERIDTQRALEASEARYRTLVQGIPQLTWTSLPDGWRDYASPQWLSYTGMGLDEALGSLWLGAIHPEDREATAAAWRRAVESEEPYEAAFRLRRHDGVYRRFLARALPMRDEESILVKWIGVSTDVQDSWASQRALERQATRQRGVAEAAYRITHARSVEDVLRLATQLAREILGARAALVRLQNDPEGLANWSGSLSDGRSVWTTVGAMPDIERLVVSLGDGFQAARIDLSDQALRQKLARIGLGDTVEGATSALIAPMLNAEGERLGVMLVCPGEEGCGPEEGAVLVQLAQIVTSALQNARLTEGLLATSERLERANRETFDRLARAAALRDEDTAEHTDRVGLLSQAIARTLGFPEEEAARIGKAAELHDLGKIGVPDAILRKAGPLTPFERSIMQTHAALGARLLEGCEDPVLRLATTIAHTHHERWDGEGVPAGARGEGHSPRGADRFRGRLVRCDDQGPSLPQGHVDREGVRDPPRGRRHAVGRGRRRRAHPGRCGPGRLIRRLGSSLGGPGDPNRRGTPSERPSPSP